VIKRNERNGSFSTKGKYRSIMATVAIASSLAKEAKDSIVGINRAYSNKRS